MLTGRDIAEAVEPRTAVGIFAPPRVHDDVDELLRAFGTAIGDREIPPAAAGLLAEAVAVIVMYPDAEGLRASELLAEADDRMGDVTVRAKIAAVNEKRGPETTTAAVTVLRELMDGWLAALGDRNLPFAARDRLLLASTLITDHAV